VSSQGKQLLRVIDPHRIYTLDEVGELLGVKARTVHEYVKRGELRGRRVGIILIVGTSLIDFLENKKA
jgi:excisionase family DNA binding protein